MSIRSQFDRLCERMTDVTSHLSRQQRRSLERRLRKESQASLSPESLEARALLAVVVPGYEVTQDWGSGFQGSMTLENRDAETVENWTVSFDYAADINSIWDAKVVSREGARYTISNAGWNGSLTPGSVVSFGFVGSGDTTAPTNYTINGEPLEGVPPPADDPANGTSPDQPAGPPADDPARPIEQLTATLHVVSDWGAGFTGDVTVANAGDQPVEGWTVRFDFAGEISSVWNGEIVSRSGSTYMVRGASWNSTLPAAGAVSFGFSATPGGAAAVFENVVVSGVYNGPEPGDPTPDAPPLDPPDTEPDPTSDPGDGQGRVFVVAPADADIVGFNTSTDRLDFGDNSVHNLIVGKLATGEVAIVNPWSWAAEYQVVSDVSFTDLTLDNLGVVVNEHLRQDLGGVLSWEQGVGPREAGTFYVRSHEYGVHDRIEGFDPAVNKLSFLYFGTRERLSVEDTTDGVLISVEPTGQSMLLVGVAKSELVPGNIEFHHDQIVEDQLEVPFGFTVEQVTMVSRTALLTPFAPEGEVTDGHQTSPGSDTPHDGGHDHGGMPMDPGTEPGTTDPGTTDPGAGDTDPGAPGDDAVDDAFAGLNSGNVGDEKWGEAYFAPYVDMGLWPVPNLSQIAQSYGTSLLTLGFLQADSNGSPAWAGLSALAIDSDFPQAADINASIDAFQAAGGDVMISLGGAAGISLAQAAVASGIGAEELAATYASVVDRYHLSRIDFDIEGAAVADARSIALRSEAIELLQQQRPDLEVWYTLPVLPAGLTADGLNVVRSALAAGVKLDGVNVMAMDYGESAAPTSGPNARTMGDYAIMAAENTHAQLSNLFAEYGQGFAWRMVGVTPMIGVNDVLSEVFTVDDAQMLEDFAREKGLGMLSMWSVARDKPGTIGQATATASGLDVAEGSFSAVFNDYGTVNQLTFGGATTPADPPSNPPADPGTDPGGDTGSDPGADAPASDLAIASYDGIIAAYFPEWGIYGRDYQLDDVPADKINRLIYAFANLTAEGEMTLYDSYAAVEKRFSAAESVTGEADLWYYPPEDPRSQQTVWGNFNQLAQLKEMYPHLRTSIAVGGWTLSGNFSTVASTEAGRETFANSIVEFLTTYTMFDGIDFDWEYPGGGGLESNSVSASDGANYALLLANVRGKLDTLESQTGRTYEISVASPAGIDKIANFNLAGLAPSVDFFNVMAYDFHGTWENTTGHQAAFTGDADGYDIKTAVHAYLDAGVPGEKIVLGAPLYTRGWSGVADGGDGGYDEAASGGAPGTFETGVYDYKDLLAQVQDPNSGWQLYWDDVAQASYVYNAELDLFSSIETPTSIALKAQWVQEMGLGGMMFWDLTNDATDSPESLVAAAFRSLVLEDDFQSIRASSSLTDEVILGGDGEINPWSVI